MHFYKLKLQASQLQIVLWILMLLATACPINTVHAQAIFQVDTWSDEADGNHGDGICATTYNECTLRAAIEEANASPNGTEPDMIYFTNFPILAWFGLIEVETLLPTITEAVFIDGTTARGDVILDGRNTEGLLDSYGLTLGPGSQRSTVRGLTIGKFKYGIAIFSSKNAIENNYIGVLSDGSNYGNDDAGIMVYGNENTIGGISNGNIIGFNQHGIRLSNAENTTIQSNYIGVDQSGLAIGNENGIRLDDAVYTLVGGATADHGNIVGFNDNFGIHIYVNCNGIVIRNNYIGTDEWGNNLGNADSGIYVTTCTENLKIGGKKARGNVIGFNRDGIHLHNSDNVIIRGNFIGTDRSGRAVGNTHTGMTIEGSVSSPKGNHSTNNVVGYGVEAYIRENESLANTIAYNGKSGIALIEHNYAYSLATENAIRGNSIFANEEAGIDLDADGYTTNDLIDEDEGSNNLQNHPEIDRAFYRPGSDEIAIEFIVSSDTAYTAYPLTIDAYIADDPISAQGKTYIGTVTYETPNELDRFEIPAGDVDWTEEDVVVLTATDANGNTSEFSPASGELGDQATATHWHTDSLSLKKSHVQTQSGATLSNPYPNPFNPQTTFTLSIPESAYARISVHDLLGRQVALLHDGVLTAGIAHTFTVNGSTMASGTYLLHVVTSSFTKTKRLMLLK